MLPRPRGVVRGPALRGQGGRGGGPRHQRKAGGSDRPSGTCHVGGDLAAGVPCAGRALPEPLRRLSRRVPVCGEGGRARSAPEPLRPSRLRRTEPQRAAALPCGLFTRRKGPWWALRGASGGRLSAPSVSLVCLPRMGRPAAGRAADWAAICRVHNGQTGPHSTRSRVPPRAASRGGGGGGAGAPRGEGVSSEPRGL